MADPHFDGSAQKTFFRILHSDRSLQVHELMVNGFSEKKFCSGQMGYFRHEIGPSRNSGSTLKIF